MAKYGFNGEKKVIGGIEFQSGVTEEVNENG